MISPKLKSASPNVLPREIEVKIIRHAPKNLAEFQALMNRAKARLKIPRRLLVDRRFKLHRTPSVTAVTFPTTFFKNEKELKMLAHYLGTVLTQKNNQWVVSVSAHQKLPSRIVRIRIDGNKIIWNVKQAISKKNREGQGVSNRAEVEAEITDAALAEKSITALGYHLAANREKYRTTYRLGNSLIEFNESPSAQVAPWLEIEGPNRETIFSIAGTLGFKKTDLAAMSEAEYMARSGLTKSQIKHLVFTPTKR